MTASPSLSGRTAIVTGASSGIGRAIAERFGACGAHVFLAGRTQAAMEASKKRIEESGGKASVVCLDVRDVQQVQDLVAAAVAATGRLDIMVNNAGLSHPRPITEGDAEEWRAMLETNVLALLVGSQAAVRAMRKCGAEGYIVNISSIAAEIIVPGSGHYSAAKAGTNMLTRTFAQELGPRIRVNCVMPGAVPTQIMMKAMNLTDDDLPGFEKMIRLPAGRLGTPQDLGAAVLYFSSKATEWVTGQCIRVSGGP